jgi:hypothetical protein
MESWPTMPIFVAASYRTYESLLANGELAAQVKGRPCPP